LEVFLDKNEEAREEDKVQVRNQAASCKARAENGRSSERRCPFQQHLQEAVAVIVKVIKLSNLLQNVGTLEPNSRSGQQVQFLRSVKARNST